MYTTIAKFLPLYDSDPAEVRTEHETFEAAELNGYRNAALGPVTEVGVYGNDGQVIAHYRSLTNYWYVFRNKEGNFISRQEYLEKDRMIIEKQAHAEGFNLEIKPTSESWFVTAGEVTTEIDPDMLPWVDQALDKAFLTKWRHEDRGVEPVSQEELAEIFNGSLETRKSEALAQYPNPAYRLSVLPSTLPPSLALRG